VEHRRLSLMFTDIVGYSRLMGQNEKQTIELLGEYRRILLAQIEHYNGTVIEFIGDAVFAHFDTPDAAVNAGIEIQNELDSFNKASAHTLPKLQSRIGIHMGDVAIKDGALFGDDVNIAARLEPIAVADSLCISESVYEEIKDSLNAPVLSLGLQPLKNISHKIRAYLIRPAGITLGTHTHYLIKKLNQKARAYRYPIIAICFASVVAGFYLIPRWLVPGYTANYVEIADFENLMSQNGEPDYFSAGITDALRAQLADIRDVYILEAGKGVRGPLRLEGSVQKMGDGMRIAYRLFRRKDKVQIAGGKLDASYKDIFILQDRVVAEIAGYLAREFKLDDLRPAALKLTSDVTAYDYYLRGLEYLKKPQSHENYDAAIKLMSTALVHDESFARANAGLCDAYAGKYEITRLVDWATRAEEVCQLALTQDDRLSKVYESLGSIYKAVGKFEKAIGILRRALELDETNVEAMAELAKVYSKQNKRDQAEVMFTDAISRYPNAWKTYQKFGAFLLLNGRYHECIENYKKVLGITPENSLAYSNMAICHFYLADYKGAARTLGQSVKSAPSSWGYSNTGTMHYFAGEFRKAAFMFHEALRLSPGDYRLHVNLADALRQVEGKYSEAIKEYEKAIDLALKSLELNDNDARVHQYLAISHLYAGNKDKAAFYIQNAQRLSPEDVEVTYARVRFWSQFVDMEMALSALSALIKIGYSQELLEVDPDLAGLRSLPQYSDIVMKKSQHD